jgi:hypothetical protein
MGTSKRFARRWIFALTLIAEFIVAGCSNSKIATVVPNPSTPVGLPTPPSAGSVNTYTGAESPGAWTLTLDNTNNVYSFSAVTFPSQAAASNSGALTKTNGFTRLGASGYALEVKGRVAVFRPGDISTPLVFAVPQAQCYPIGGRLRFQFIGMQTSPNGAVGSAGPTNGYGSVVASTDTTGTSWQFQNLQGNIVNGPAIFAGTCSSAGSQAGIELSGQTVLNDLWPPNEEIQTGIPAGASSSIWIGPSGFFVADQSEPGSNPPTGASIAGMSEPSSPLPTLDMTSQVYLGFLYEPATTPYLGSAPSPAVTSPVTFGQAGVSGSALIGGDFPNDDITQPPNSDIAINPGKQDATLNGLYTSVSITVSDPAQNCANYTGSGENATFGITPDGSFICTFPGVAVAGNPEGKYALFVSTYNWAAQLGGAPMDIYLFQK